MNVKTVNCVTNLSREFQTSKIDTKFSELLEKVYGNEALNLESSLSREVWGSESLIIDSRTPDESQTRFNHRASRIIIFWPLPNPQGHSSPQLFE